MSRLISLTLAIILIIGASATAFARFDCGRTAKRLTGSSCGSNLALAWATNCPHTYAHAGAVVVSRRHGRALGGGPGGHVALIVTMGSDQCHATVHDEKGIYVRDICKNQVAIVTP